MEFSRQEYWNGLPFPSPGDLTDPGIEPRSPTLQADSLPSEPLQGHAVQLSRVQLFVTPWTTACQASLSITNSRSLLKLMSIESVMPSNHLILCHPLLPHPIFPRIGVFSSQFFASGDQSVGASASASVLPMNTQN